MVQMPAMHGDDKGTLDLSSARAGRFCGWMPCRFCTALIFLCQAQSPCLYVNVTLERRF